MTQYSTDERGELLRLAERVEGLRGPDRDLDAEIAERVYGWCPHRIPADYDGENACDVLTPDGKPFTVDSRPWVYPPKGVVHRAYHCPALTRDCIDPAFSIGSVRRQTADVIRARAQVSHD